ncbi:MAG: CYTH domain-containing protein [Flavobacteriaceae bacterium]
MLEIERKFLVTSEDYQKEATSKSYIIQGFLNSHPNRTVRVRVEGEKGFLTIKGISSKDGTTRFEWETKIPLEEAKKLLPLCEKGIIEKYRYKVFFEGNLFEIDEFLGENQGLIIAEIELNEAHQAFEKPNWLGEEVTGQAKYYNSQLSKKPFKTW